MPESACPEPMQLVAMLRGTLDESSLEQLVRHLEQCPHCEQKLTELEQEGAGDDLVLDRLKDSKGADAAQLLAEVTPTAPWRPTWESDEASYRPWKTGERWWPTLRFLTLLIGVSVLGSVLLWQLTAPPETLNDIEQFQHDFALLKAQQQRPSIMMKLTLLNPNFDGKATFEPAQGPVKSLTLVADHLVTIWPIGRLHDLRELDLKVVQTSSLSSLTGIEDLQLRVLRCRRCPIQSLEPVNGMPLEVVDVRETQVTSLQRLRHDTLRELWCDESLWKATLAHRPRIEWPRLQLLNGEPYAPQKDVD